MEITQAHSIIQAYSIGFTQTTAARFFGRLTDAGVKRLLDVRLHRSSQLAGFAKHSDLTYFLQELCGIGYAHEPLLAPTQDLLDGYRKRKGSWADYEGGFQDLMASRQVETQLERTLFAVPTVLLCSEPTPEHCHRRLALEFLQAKWENFEIVHL